MKIRIKESQYTKLNEAVGVPTNIVEVAQQLYNKIISSLDPNDDINSFEYFNHTLSRKTIYPILYRNVIYVHGHNDIFKNNK